MRIYGSWIHYMRIFRSAHIHKPTSLYEILIQYMCRYESAHIQKSFSVNAHLQKLASVYARVYKSKLMYMPIYGSSLLYMHISVYVHIVIAHIHKSTSIYVQLQKHP